ncbi:MAG: hypothetical protein K6E63_00875 [Lachnospiraceae bacterium]|nr:hypothetical protein [Lachnospiraceae bacterium]
MFVISLYPIIVEFGYVTINRKLIIEKYPVSEQKRYNSKNVFILLILFIIPTIMLFYTQIHFKHIDISDAEKVTVHFSEYVETTGHTSVRYVSFTDYKNLNVLVDSNTLGTVKYGSELTILKDPNADIAIGIYEDNKIILDYEKSINAIDIERTGWMIFIIIIYIIICGFFIYFKRWNG